MVSARFGVAGQQQLDAGVGAVQAPRGVDARRQAKADRLLVDGGGVGLGDPHQRAQADALGATERDEALAHEPAVLAAQRNAVGDRGQRDDVEVLVGLGRIAPGGLQQSAGELVRDAGGAEVRGGIPAGHRMDGRSGRQPAVGSRLVVIGDDHVEPELVGARDLLDRGDRAVDGDDAVPRPRPPGARRCPC